MERDALFAKVAVQDDQEYVCPLELVRTKSVLSVDELADCVEADVLGRYSGMLKVVKNA